jgi:hypothetical protein
VSPRPLALVVLLLTLAGCSIGTSSPEELETSYPLARWTAASPRGIRRSLALLEKEFGRGYQLRTVSISTHSFSADVQPPGRAGELDSISFWKGSLRDRTPKQTSAQELEKLGQELFSPDPALFDRIPGLLLASIKQSGLPEARVTHVHIARSWRSPQLEIRVSVTNKRRNATVRWSAAGALIEIQQH